MQTRIHPLLIAVAAAALAACGFGDDRIHPADDEPVTCGDTFVDADEGCDDGDTDDGDGCDADCEVEAGWNCSGEPSVCTEGLPTCGDGAIAAGEECDDEDTESGDGCDDDCQVEAGWECAGSPSVCTQTCGDGAIDSGEECDDSDTQGGDGCNGNCAVEAGWECTGEPSVCNEIAGACTLVPQSGCSGTQACDLTAAENGDTTCRAVTGNGTADSLCNTAPTQCVAGYTCVGLTDTVEGCMKFCGTDNHCNGVGSRCVLGLINSSTGDPIPGVEICTNACDPLQQTGCPSGFGCMPYNMAGGDVTDCEDMGTRLDGQSCSEVTDCLPGSICVGQSGGGAICAEMCEVGGAATCGGGNVCTGFQTVILIGSREIGACL